MNLNDPFGRVARRDEKEYQELRTALKNEGVNSRVALDAVAARIQRRCLGTAAIALALASLLFVFLPRLGAVVIVVALAMLLWVVRIMLSGRRHIRRYAEEELGQSGSTARPM